jgi:calcineurin-like phosphoesterase family protein
MSKNYFSSDFHLGHANIIKYDKRPFKSVQEMDERIIKNVCTLLKPGDNLYYLGDFALTDSNKAEGHMKAIAYMGANLFFIKGNHDKRDTIKLYQKYGTYLGEQKKIKVGEREVVINHYAMRVWDKSHHGCLHLYGHSHDALEHTAWGRSMDCSIITAYRIKGEYTLFEFEEIAHILDKREIKVIDHHGKTNRE